MNDMIEKLKNNLCQWRYMPKAERDFMQSLPPYSVGIIGERGDLYIFKAAQYFWNVEDIYRIVPDYEPEPEIVKCEVYEHEGLLFYKRRPELEGELLFYALCYADYVRCEDEDGNPCGLRGYEKQNKPAKRPVYILFKGK